MTVEHRSPGARKPIAPDDGCGVPGNRPRRHGHGELKVRGDPVLGQRAHLARAGTSDAQVLALAVGLWPRPADPEMLDAELAAGVAVCVRDVGRAVVGHDGSHGDPALPEPRNRAYRKATAL